MSRTSALRKGESAPLKVLVGDADLKRVRAAELVILDEEGREGKFARNHDGQFVPFQQVEEEEHRKRLELDRGRPLDQPARAPKHMAPYAGPRRHRLPGRLQWRRGRRGEATVV